MVQATNAIVRRDTLSAPAVFPAHMSPISTAGDPLQRVINPAPQDMSLVVAKRNRQLPGSPSRRQQSKSPPVKKVAVAQKVRVVAQDDPRREEEFELMKKSVRLLISDYRFPTDKHQVACRTLPCPTYSWRNPSNPTRKTRIPGEFLAILPGILVFLVIDI